MYVRLYVLIPLILFLGLLYALWNGLSLNPIYQPPIPKELNLVEQHVTDYIFNTSDQSEKFQSLLKSFRCVTCQNQSLADSSAPIAMNMKGAIYKKLNEGHTEEEIRDFLVTCYGDFVLYNPPFKKETLLLWLGPGLFFLIGLGFAVKSIRDRRSIG